MIRVNNTIVLSEYSIQCHQEVTEDRKKWVELKHVADAL